MTRFKTDVGVLLQPRSLEAPAADTRRETSETPPSLQHRVETVRFDAEALVAPEISRVAY